MRRADKLAAGKFDVDVALVKRLVASQFPQWAGLAVRPVEQDGWDNWTFRLGDRLSVRLPSDAGYAEQAAKEAFWLPRLASQLPLPVPTPVGSGRPGDGYPWNWTIYDWIDGEPAVPELVADRAQLADDLSAFLLALQAADPADAPQPGRHSAFRGADLMTVYGVEARRSVDSLAGVIDIRSAHAVLDAAIGTTAADPPVWVHGDIAVGNLLVRNGRLAAVIDFGCSAVGDPACDLVIAWLSFSGTSRARFRAEMGGDSALWARARAWALWKAALVEANGSVVHPAEASPLQVIQDVIAEAAAEN